MRKIIFLLFASGTLMFSCKKSISPAVQAGLSTNVSNLHENGLVASNDSAFNIVQYAGSNAATPGSSNGTSGDPTTALFDSPEGIVFDTGGNMFVADRDNQVIRKITTAGVVSIFAGTLGVMGFADGTGTAAKFNIPIRLAIDGSDNLYVADRDNAKIRKITPAAVVTTIAGSTVGSGATQFNWPVDVAVSSDGTKLYVADSKNNRIQKIIKSGSTYTTSLLAGQLTAGYHSGTGAVAQFNSPSGVAIDSRGYVLVADRYNTCIREITTASAVYRYAGAADSIGNVDAPFGTAKFSQPYGITVANDGCVYVSDIGNHNIRRISNHGMFVHTVAGSGSSGNALGNYSSFNTPTSVAIDNSGNFYVASAGDNNIRKLVPESRVLQITAGWGVPTTPYPGITWYVYQASFWMPSRKDSLVAIKPQKVNVLDIDLNVNHLVFKEIDSLNPPRKTLTTIVGSDATVLAAMSGTFATFESNLNAHPRHHSSYLRVNGQTLWDAHVPFNDKYWVYHSAMFYIAADGVTVGLDQNAMDISHNPFNPTPLYPNMMSGAPVLIVNSKPIEATNPPPDWNDTIQALRTKVAARSVIAIPIINHHVLLISAEGLESVSCYTPRPTAYWGMTTGDLAQFIQQYFHAIGAENFDGGGTSTMCLKNKGYIHSGSIGIINFPAYDSHPCPADITPYGQQRTIGDAIEVVAN